MLQSERTQKFSENIIVQWDFDRAAMPPNPIFSREFNLHCYFIPDEVHVSCCVFPVDNLNAVVIDPMENSVGGFFNSNVYSLSANLPLQNASSVLTVCNAGNSYNPVSVFTNNSRCGFQGTYTMNASNATQDVVAGDYVNNPVYTGGFLVKFDFIRY